eukprot:gene7492-8323_t
MATNFSTPRETPRNDLTDEDESVRLLNNGPDVSPPPYFASPDCNMSESIQPPAYDEAVKLPTYSEVEDMHREGAIREMFGLSTEQDPNDLHETNDDIRIGTDLNFIVCFLLSFLLNWIGLLAGYCFGTTIACQYGALSGFGLSLVKWGLVVQHTSCCQEVVTDRPWLIWLFIITVVEKLFHKCHMTLSQKVALCLPGGVVFPNKDSSGC